MKFIKRYADNCFKFRISFWLGAPASKAIQGHVSKEDGITI